MSAAKAFCPKCKNDVVFIHSGGVNRCPACGFEYESTEVLPPTRERQWAERAMSVMSVLVRVALILVAIWLVGLAVLFAGCVIGFR